MLILTFYIMLIVIHVLLLSRLVIHGMYQLSIRLPLVYVLLVSAADICVSMLSNI